LRGYARLSTSRTGLSGRWKQPDTDRGSAKPRRCGNLVARRQSLVTTVRDRPAGVVMERWVDGPYTEVDLIELLRQIVTRENETSH
jgi:hypothetical protein